MTEKQYEVYDFRSAGTTSGIAAAFEMWTGRSGQALSNSWAGISDIGLTLQSRGIRTTTFSTSMEGITSSHYCSQVFLEDRKITSMWSLSREDLHLIVACLLNQGSEFEAPDRALTPIELGMCELFMQMLTRALSAGWPDKSALSCECDELAVNPKRLRLFKAKDLVAATSLELTFPVGTVTVRWTLPGQESTSLLETVNGATVEKRPDVDPGETVGCVPLELTAILGQTTFTMHRLCTLAPGDLLMLDQKVDEPVLAKIDGQAFYECWPGKLGNVQGLEIKSCV